MPVIVPDDLYARLNDFAARCRVAPEEQAEPGPECEF